MISSQIVGTTLLINIVCLFLLNMIYLILAYKDPGYKSKRITYGIDASGFYVNLTGITSTLMIILWIISIFDLLRNLEWMKAIIIPLSDEFNILGLGLVTIGSLLFIYARRSREKVAPAWGLTAEMRLITVGPYKWIRNGSYTAYFLWFLGLPFATGNWIFLLFLPGIMGYTKVVESEEELLERHFGEQFVEYKKRTKKFIPYLW